MYCTNLQADEGRAGDHAKKMGWMLPSTAFLRLSLLDGIGSGMVRSLGPTGMKSHLNGRKMVEFAVLPLVRTC